MAHYDLIIRGGTIVDGTGALAFTGDVAVKDGLIAAVKKRLLQKAESYVATIRSGVVTFRDGAWTGEAPSGLIRGPQRVELA